MKAEEIYKIFIDIEAELNLFEQKIKGVYFWERIRFYVHREISIKASRSKFNSSRKRSKKGLLKKFLKSFRNFFLNNPYLCRKKPFLLYGHPRRKKYEGGVYWDLYLDPIIDKIFKTSDYVYLEPYYFYLEEGHFHPPKTKEIKYADIISLISFILKFFIRITLTKSEKEKVDEIQDIFYKYYKIKIDICSHIKAVLFLNKTRLWQYKLLLSIIAPKVVFLVVSYGNEDFIEACKSKKIPVIELQHGLVYKTHMGYSFAHENDKKTFPDYFFSFGEFWKETTKFPIKKEFVFNVGFPLLESKVEQYKDIKKQNKVIFISSGPGGEWISEFAIELTKIKPNNYKIIYKLHPQEYKFKGEWYEKLYKTNIEVVDNDKIDLYRYLAESKIVIGVASTVIYESIAFDCSIYLLDLPGISTMHNLFKYNGVKKIRKPSEVNFIEVEKNKPLKKDIFFRSNWEENFKNAVNYVYNERYKTSFF